MSQEQPQRPQPVKDPIRYGDVFNVHGDLASKVIAPVDASTMQSAENTVLGETRKGGPASVMQSAARVNVRQGLVDPHQATEVAGDPGTKVTEENVGGDRIITETIAGQVVAQYIEPRAERTTPGGALDPRSITIGEALEATALSSGEKPIDQSDAAAIQAAEVRATGIAEVLPGGIGAEAQSAATRNPRAPRDQDKTKLSDVLMDATLKLPADKPVTREDAHAVIEAEVRNKPDMHANATPGGVAASMAAAARANQE
ncbi:late embryogenesis abundant protein D-34 [Ricinus communis]|uniref:Late embryogenesis abundant protein D-34, putative n=1 Tax=Ricinus communis TaxID=3988 RepID=B9S3Z6_RICCO|nr:late embryogenesis abundant protein D-34 [Ricinus communis]EEF41677.1 Late embryogenesis abundant protein D-34, putative [Ricinus communis]|eukprot:XP_002520715.1 late embryogenesis abundant protein D-34 [Ricinus communis]